MDKEQAIYQFWSGFGLKAYDENTTPDDAMTRNGGKYLTFGMATAAIGEPVAMSASLWYKSTSWTDIDTKAKEISQAIGISGKTLPFDGGYVWICRGVPFSQRMPDDDDTIRRIYLNIMVEFISAD